MVGTEGERIIERHDLLWAGLTRWFARRLVQDARVISIRAESCHHGGWVASDHAPREGRG